MNGILKVLPMLFTYLVSYIILMEIDKKCSLIGKIDSKLKIKPVFYTSSALILILIFAVIGMYFITMSETFFYILAGLILGISLNFINIAKKN